MRPFTEKYRLAGGSARSRNRRKASRFTRTPDSEAGTGIVEALVGVSLLSVVLLAADRGGVGSLSTAVVAKEHSVGLGTEYRNAQHLELHRPSVQPQRLALCTRSNVQLLGQRGARQGQVAGRVAANPRNPRATAGKSPGNPREWATAGLTGAGWPSQSRTVKSERAGIRAEQSVRSKGSRAAEQSEELAGQRATVGRGQRADRPVERSAGK